MENILDTLVSAHHECMEQALGGRKYSLDDLYAVEQRHLQGGVFRQHACMCTVQGHRVNALSCGNGSIRVMAWSQMHGNEPVSTLALADVMNFLEGGSPIASMILQNLTIVAIPLLNPEGHLSANRRNSMGIDINRDALDLVSPEAAFLMETHAALKPDFGLNLHDQELYHITEPLRRQTLVALLAPECDEAKTVTPARYKAMQVAGFVAKQLLESPVASGRVAKYQDSYTPTAFGDTFMRKGTSSVLIEAGSVPGDHERNTARQMVFASIVMSLYAMCGAMDGGEAVSAYDALPLNIYNTMYDIVLHGLEVSAPGRKYRVDVAIRRTKTSCNDEDFADDSTDFRIANIGNLSAFAAIKDFGNADIAYNGPYNGLYVGRPADFDIMDAAGNIINVRDLLTNI